MKEIKRVLIANRGEIALRVIATCNLMDIETVTIFSEDEKDLPHANLGTRSYSLGSGTLGETYLNIDNILKIAKEMECDAIHPGYGFLSENAIFADRVRKEDVIFIGPSSDSIRLMGDKIGSKALIEEIGVPSIPGYHGQNQDPEFLKKEANKIGYPILIKATAGGGGKGMRVVHSDDLFNESLESAKREAKNAFGNDIVLIEKYITSPRHIEVQMMSDQHGNHLHFFERECSIQRRHQKIVEETPSTAVNDSLRKDITEAALKITRHINYEGAGTVEFVLDEDGKFYFLEMNTRLQVEHPVTELVCGVDLVKLQIEVASGEKIKITQKDIFQRGHAIEVRMYAEDPDNGFLPQTGTILKVGVPTVSGVRLDSGYIDGNEVTINFDPMLAKLIAYGEDRESATKKLVEALDEVTFLGIKTNRSYLRRVLLTTGFTKGDTWTHFIDSYEKELEKLDTSDESVAVAIAAFLLKSSSASSSSSSSEGTINVDYNVWNNLESFRNF
jgi:3-methylcrotonyl-CoA carboxylase alpha subunit